jgi:hypothetical protein
MLLLEPFDDGAELRSIHEHLSDEEATQQLGNSVGQIIVSFRYGW